MKVVILCGGRGTRIRDVAETLPKPMISIGQKPILWHIMKSYATAGYNRFILCLGYRGDAIRNYFLNYNAASGDCTVTLGRNRSVKYHDRQEEKNWRVTLAETGLDAMTGARVSRIRRHIGKDTDFLLTYGDGVSDIDIRALIKFHRAHGRAITITGVRPPGRFGEIGCDPTGRIQEFNEKPHAGGGLISGGFFVCRREIFDYLSDDDSLVFEQEPMRQLVQAREAMVYRHDGFWQCMDTHRDWAFLDDLWRKGVAPWKRW